MESVEKMALQSQLTIDDWRGGCTTIYWLASLRDRNGAELSHLLAFADRSARRFEEGRLNEPASLDGLV